MIALGKREVHYTKRPIYRVCCFLIMKDPFFQIYLEVTTAVVVPCGVGKTTPRTLI